jgi:hypothetical protein
VPPFKRREDGLFGVSDLSLSFRSLLCFETHVLPQPTRPTTDPNFF